MRPWNDPGHDLALALAHPQCRVLAVREQGHVVGSVVAGFDGHRGWQYYLAVHPDHQRSGLGRCLVVAAEEWLGGAGASKVQLMVRGTDTGALKFYRRLGYDVQDAVVLGRRLD